MAKATWNGTVIAESNETQVVEGNVYFPPATLNRAHVKESATTTVCGWKGTANYLTVSVNGKEISDAAWYYAAPKPEAKNITGYVAFWKGVTVEK